MTLRIFVQVCCEIDPTLNVRIDRETAQPVSDSADRLLRASPLGRAGVAAARRLRADSVTAFALGTGHTDALRQALAAGATSAVELLGDGENRDHITPAALADWLRSQQADLTIMDRAAGLIAARLGWAHLAGLDELRIEDGPLRAVRFLGRGDREVVTAGLPAVVRLQTESVQPPYVCRARIKAVAERPIEQVVLSALQACALEMGPLQAARPRTRLGQGPATPSGAASGRLQALLGGTASAAPPRRAEDVAETPEQLADKFIRYLAHHDLLPK
jgi:electron transfer flavoprotein alpha/beta subunit